MKKTKCSRISKFIIKFTKRLKNGFVDIKNNREIYFTPYLGIEQSLEKNQFLVLDDYLICIYNKKVFKNIVNKILKVYVKKISGNFMYVLMLFFVFVSCLVCWFVL